MSSGHRVKPNRRRFPVMDDVTSTEGLAFGAATVVKVANAFNGVSSVVKKRVAILVKTPGSKNRERPPTASLRMKKRQRQSYNKNEMDPLAQAQKIQGEKSRNDRKPRSKSGRECLSPLCTSSTPPGFETRKESGGNEKLMVDLCSSGCDTDDESDKRSSSNKTTPTLPPPTTTSPPLKKESNPRQSKTKSSKKKQFQANIEKKRRKLPPETPTYPSTCCPQSSTPAKDYIDYDDDDTENDSVAFQSGSPSYTIDLHEQNQDNEDDCNPNNNKNNEDDLTTVESVDLENGTAFEDQSTLKKKTKNVPIGQGTSSEINVGSCGEEIVELSAKKKTPPNNVNELTAKESIDQDNGTAFEDQSTLKKKTKNVPIGQGTSSEINVGSCGEEIVELSAKKKTPPNNVNELTAKESIDQDNGTAFEDQSTLKKKTKKFPIGQETSSEIHPESCEERIVERIPMKKPPTTSIKHSEYTVPVLKPRFQKKNRKSKHYRDVDDTEDKYDKKGGNYLNGMQNLIRDAEEANVGEAKTNFPTPRRKSNPFRCSATGLSSPIASAHSMSKLSPNSLNLKKMNSKKKPTGKPKGKKAPKKVIPGASLKQKDSRERKDDQQSHWRSEKDRDEYHNSNSSLVKMPKGTIDCQD